MRIALDAMGGDQGPEAVCKAAVEFLREGEERQLVLVGQKDYFAEHLPDDEFGDRLRTLHAPTFIGPEEEPVRAIRSKSDASMVQCLKLVRDGEADAMISLGNTGALLAGGVLISRRIRGVERPALASEIPSTQGESTLVLDLGASVDVRARHLVQYAEMGTNYAQRVMGRSLPTCGLLNVGAESKKGDALRREAYELLQEAGRGQDSWDFAGNVEARELLSAPVDVVVTDGFVGNVFLKSVEGTASALVDLMEVGMRTSVATRVGSALLLPTMRRRMRAFDYRNHGGAVLLGIRSIVIKCHGSSGQQAIVSALERAVTAVQESVPGVIRDAVAERTEDDDD